MRRPRVRWVCAVAAWPQFRRGAEDHQVLRRLIYCPRIGCTRSTMSMKLKPRPFRCFIQCSTFTGMIPVFGVLLILFEWYWYVVCESGIRTSLILAQGNRWKCTAKAKHDWRSYVFRSQRSAVFTSAHSPQAPSRATQPTSQLAAAS